MKKYTYENYYKNYYETHKTEQYLRMKKYLEKNKRNIIYKLVDMEDDVLYWGSTVSKFRINYHVNGYGKLELTEEHWNELNCKYFQYAFVDAIHSKEELLYIEEYLIQKYKNNGKLLNYNKALRVNNFDELRKVELEEIAESLEFKVYD